MKQIAVKILAVKVKASQENDKKLKILKENEENLKTKLGKQKEILLQNRLRIKKATNPNQGLLENNHDDTDVMKLENS